MTQRLPDLTLESFGLDPRQRRTMLATISRAIYRAWVAEAKNVTSHSSGYQALLRRRSNDKEASVNFGAVTLSGESAKAGMLARMVEFGMGPGGIGTEGSYDMRKFLLGGGGGGRKHTGKNGTYVNVPFKHSPESIAKAGGESLKSLVQSSEFGHSVSVAPNVTKWGKRQSDGSRAALTAKETAHVRRIIDKPTQATDSKGKRYTRSAHKTNPLQGLVKTGGGYSRDPRTGKMRKQTTGYMTFRRASWAGDPWMHPGRKAERIANIIRRNLPSILKDAGLF